MALINTCNNLHHHKSFSSSNPNFIYSKFSINRKVIPPALHFVTHKKHCFLYFQRPRFYPVVNELNNDSDQNSVQDDDINSLGVRTALSMLKFYKREISPLMPNSCRYLPTCSEYSMVAYKKYGVVKGTILTAWRLCRCNPLGGSGFDPPRWFDEASSLPPEE